jgi:hypothetical protein
MGEKEHRFSWKGALVAASKWKCVAWALEHSKIDPSEIVTRSKTRRSFKQMLWTKFATGMDASCWIDHAKTHPEMWRPEWERMKENPEARQLGWLKILFAQEQEFERYLQSLPQYVGDDSPRGKSLVVKSFQTLLKQDAQSNADRLLLKCAQAWTANPEVLDNDFFTHKLVSSLGPSTFAYKGFVELGWCSLEEVQGFQEWVKRYDKPIPNLCQTWTRPDLVAWAEKERLSQHVGVVATNHEREFSFAL